MLSPHKRPDQYVGVGEWVAGGIADSYVDFGLYGNNRDFGC